MTDTIQAGASLSPDCPWTWMKVGYEPLLAMSWRDCEEVQLAALKLQFDTLDGSVAALEKLARREAATTRSRAPALHKPTTTSWITSRRSEKAIVGR